MNRRVVLLCLSLLAVLVRPAAAAPPAVDPAVAAVVPAGFDPVGCIWATVWPGSARDRVVVVARRGGDSGRVGVLRPNGKVVWCTLRDGKVDITPRVQGGNREPLERLVRVVEAAPGTRLLLVTGYMADAYAVTVFRPMGGRLTEVFRGGSIDGPTWDATSRRLRLQQYDPKREGESVARIYGWDGRTFTPITP